MPKTMKYYAKRKAAAAYVRATRPMPSFDVLYWAYGSNLCIEQMQDRCPGAVQVGALNLQNSALVFRGFADIVGRREGYTPGGLWRITREHEKTLDRREGVRSGCYKKVYITLTMEDGTPHKCLLYQHCFRGIMPPSAAYAATMIRGYRDFGLPLEYLEAAIDRAWEQKQPTPYQRRRFKGEQLFRRGA